MDRRLAVSILSLFPHYFTSPLQQSILGRAIARGILEVDLCDIREYSSNRYKSVDSHPYGGGAGMVMMPEPIAKAIDDKNKNNDYFVVYLSPSGVPLNRELVLSLAEKERLILLCGHYEGIDQRIIDTRVQQEISIGDYILTNGCSAALVVLESVVRHLPFVLGNRASLFEESFENDLLEYPHYTSPRNFEECAVPEVLLSGHHQKIADWRKEKAKEKTRIYRPDLYQRYQRMIDEKKEHS